MGYYVMSVESGGSWLDGRRLPRGVWLPLRNGSELCVGQVYLCVVLLVALVVCLYKHCLWCVVVWCVMCVVRGVLARASSCSLGAWGISVLYVLDSSAPYS